MKSVYLEFGLSEPEIALIAGAAMKRDYFYTSPLGRRLFQLDLGPLSLALVGAGNHNTLDDILAGTGWGVPLAREILRSKRVDWRKLLGPDAPREKAPEEARKVPAPAPVQAPVPAVTETERPAPALQSLELDIPALLEAAAALSGKKTKNGSGRAAEALARQFAISPATVYLARKLAREADSDVLDSLKQGRLSITQACKRLRKDREADRILALEQAR
jgi:hypothetical protein